MKLSGSQELILASEARTAALETPLRSALRAAAQSGPLERVTLLAAQPDALVWLRADYQAPGSRLDSEDANELAAASSSTAVPAALPAPTTATASLPILQRSGELVRARTSTRRDPTEAYLATLEGGAPLSRGALLDVLA